MCAFADSNRSCVFGHRGTWIINRTCACARLKNEPVAAWPEPGNLEVAFCDLASDWSGIQLFRTVVKGGNESGRRLPVSADDCSANTSIIENVDIHRHSTCIAWPYILGAVIRGTSPQRQAPRRNWSSHFIAPGREALECIGAVISRLRSELFVFVGLRCDCEARNWLHLF